VVCLPYGQAEALRAPVAATYPEDSFLLLTRLATSTAGCLALAVALLAQTHLSLLSFFLELHSSHQQLPGSSASLSQLAS
jgi:hypothetical protein